jgi:hypothetical protein
LIVGLQDNRPGNAQLFRQIAGGGQSIRRSQRTRQDGLPQAAVNLSKERIAAPRKWYRQLHTKWIFDSTTTRVIL